MKELIRKKDEAIFIGDDIEIVILGTQGDKVRLGINAPSSLAVHKGEEYETYKQIQQFNRESVYNSSLERVQKCFKDNAE